MGTTDVKHNAVSAMVLEGGKVGDFHCIGSLLFLIDPREALMSYF